MGNVVSQRKRDLSDVAPMHWLAVVGFSCLIGWELSTVFAPSALLLVFADIEEAVIVRTVSVLALLVAFIVLSKEADWYFDNRNRLIIVGLVLSLVSVLFAIAGAFIVVPFFALFVAWALLGFGQALIAQFWCVFFSLVPSERTMANIIYGGAGGTVFYAVANALGPNWAGYGLLVVFMIVSVGVALTLSNLIPDKVIPDVSEFNEDASLGIPAFISIATCSAVYGFMTIEVCGMGARSALIGGCSGFLGYS